jgi:bacteriocin biosynthesis cyclodehydratase domain-containing protein
MRARTDAARRVAALSAISGSDPVVRQLLGQLFDPNIGFPDRPLFIDDVDVFEMPDGLGFFIPGGETPALLRGRFANAAIAYLRPLLDGAHTVEQLLVTSPPGLPVQALIRTLLVLHSKGLLTREGSTAGYRGDEVGRRQRLYWGRHLALTRSASCAGEIDQRLMRARVLLVGTGLFGAAVADLLSRTGVGRIDVVGWDDDGTIGVAVDGMPGTSSLLLPTTDVDQAISVVDGLVEGVDLLITATCDAPQAFLEEMNELALAARVWWLIGNSAGSAVDLGPLVLPYESACYTCLLLRQRSAEPIAVEREIYQESKRGPRHAGERDVIGESVWASTQAASFLVGEAVRVLSGIAAPTLTDSVLRLLPVSGILERSQVLRVPRCPACYRGDVPATAIDLQPSQAGRSGEWETAPR